MFLFIIISLILVVCNYYIDIPVALFIQRYCYSNFIWFSYTSDLPDALLLVVGITTAGAYACYRIRVHRNIIDAMTKLYLLIAVAVPVSYGAKSIAKFICGRVNTRVWLQAHETYGFHWFQGGGPFCGFPSGHMAVFTTLLAVLWRVCPRWKYQYLFAGTVLAAALIATNYHFVGDIVAGAYLGMMVEGAVYRLISRWRSGQNGYICGS
jgi:membrane-associated phospholipid phosphatase